MSISFYIVAICLIFSAFFSASETALTSISKAYVLSKAQNGSKRARLIHKMLSEPQKLITTLLIGNNIVNIFFTIIATELFIKYVGNSNTLVLGLIITLIVLILAEILPKTYAVSRSIEVSFLLSPLIYLIIIILSPITWIFLSINKFLLKYVLKNKRKKSSDYNGTVDTLRGAIELFNREEDDAKLLMQEKEMLHSVLDLTELKAEDIMNHRKNIFCIDINDKKENIIENLINSAYTRIPVFKNNPDNIIGIINVKDIFKSYYKNPKEIDLNSIVKKAYFIPETTYIIDLLTYFKEKQERLALVVDEYGTFMGIITLGDIIEEITGELKITEQHNINEIIHKNKDSFIVAGDLKIRDLNRKMGWELPDEEFTTVAGLILYETGKIPNVGNVFIFHNFKFEILEKRRHQLMKIKITPML
jgi:Mg2+/Co2+ transporter CorB